MAVKGECVLVRGCTTGGGGLIFHFVVTAHNLLIQKGTVHNWCLRLGMTSAGYSK